jgi:hypothetical protein
VKETFRVTNRGNIPALLDSGVIVPASGSATAVPFIIISPIGPIEVPPGEGRDIVIQYNPSAAGTDSAIWKSGELEALLIGTARGAYRVWLTTAAGNAGDIVTLELQIDPQAAALQRISGFIAIVSFDSTALFIERARAAGTSADISFELDDGMIALSGCDIGRTPPVARRARLEALKLVPGSDLAELTFRAAEGAPVSVRIAGIDGQLLRAFDMSRGTGHEQTAALPLTDLPPGLLFVELRVANDRITLPVMLVR